jgi:hypothetical protein
MDAGPDMTQSDVVVPDSGKDGTISDADAADVSTPPPPDGSVVWLNHYNNNVYPFGQPAYADLAVNENGGLTYLVAGDFRTDPSAGDHFNFGTITLGPATGSDLVAGGLSATGSAVWAKTPTVMAGSANHYQALTVDSGGNVYVIGTTYASSITVKNALPGPTSFVAKLTATGTPLWDHAYTSSTNPVQGPMFVALAGSQLVVAMTYNGSITYDTGLTTNSSTGSDTDVFITALDTSTGATKWTGSFGSSNNDFVNGMVATPTGDVVLVGSMNGTMQGLTGPGLPLAQVGDAGTGQDLYVLKVDSTGKATTGLVMGDQASTVYPTGIAYTTGTIALTAYFTGAVDFGTGMLTATSVDGVVLTLNETTKKTNFAVQLAGSASDGFTAVTLDPWGEVVAAGWYGDSNASAQLGPQALPQTSVAVGGMVLAKWSTTGTLLWAHGYVPTLDGGAAPYITADASNVHDGITPTRVQTTSTGRIVVTATMTGGTDFGLGYQGQLSTFAYGHCTCKFCSACFLFNPPACCNTVVPGFSADGIVGVWQP